MVALAIKFKNKADKESTIKFNKMKDGITKEEAVALGDLIIAKNLFFAAEKELVSIVSCEIEESTFL